MSATFDLTAQEFLGIAPDWQVVTYPSTVELVGDGVRACIAKPYDAQPMEWWREQAKAAIAKSGT
jgi:hypothetical protein